MDEIFGSHFADGAQLLLMDAEELLGAEANMATDATAYGSGIPPMDSRG